MRLRLTLALVLTLALTLTMILTLTRTLALTQLHPLADWTAVPMLHSFIGSSRIATHWVPEGFRGEGHVCMCECICV